MSRVWVTGYRSYELGIFNDKDPKQAIIKQALTTELSRLIENGATWIITGGQTGTEQWAAEVANDLKKKYPNEFRMAVMLPFQEFGVNWNETNKAKLRRVKNLADFSQTVSNRPYESPQQLQNYQQFMLNHTDQSLLLYDEESEGKTKYDVKKIGQYAERHPYPFQMIDFDELDDIANDYQQNLNDDF